MPTWMLCRDCGRKTYTANSNKDQIELTCSSCGGKIEVISKQEWERF